MIHEFNKPVLRELSNELTKAVQAFAEKHGLTVQGAGGSFDKGKWTAKLAFHIKVATGGVSGEEAEFKRLAAQSLFSGVKPEHYRHEFTRGGDRFVLVAFRPGSPKFNLIGERVSDKKLFKFSSRDILQNL